MWRRGGRSSALERAEALLSTKKRHTTATSTDAAVKPRCVPPKALISDLKEPPVSPDSEEGIGVMGWTDVETSGDRGGSRFIKKGPRPALVHKDPVQHRPEPRYLTSSVHGSQGPASSRLGQTENHVPRSKQSRQEVGVSTGTRSAEAAPGPSTRLSQDPSLNGRRFLKNKAAASGPKRSRSGATPPSEDASAPLDEGTTSVRIVGGVSLDSDEEDMKRLLDESVDSTVHPRRPDAAASTTARQKMLDRQSHKVIWSSVASLRRPSPSDPAPPCHGRTGPAQTLLSPSVLSPSPHRPFVSASPPESPLSTDGKDRPRCPRRSLSSASSQQRTPSLEELFPVVADSNQSHSETSSEDFQINVMALDDLEPGFTEDSREKEHRGPPGGLEEDREVLDYHSDFDSVTRTETSTSQISEHILGEGEEEETGSEVRDKAAGSRLSCQKTEEDYSSSVSDTNPKCSSRTSDHSQNTKASGAVRQCGSTEPHGGCTCGRSLGDPGPDHVSKGGPQYVHAFSTYNPSMVVLIEILKQQLDVTRRFMDRSRHLHSCLVQSLEPPNYRYTSLEDVKGGTRTHADAPPDTPDWWKRGVSHVRHATDEGPIRSSTGIGFRSQS